MAIIQQNLLQNPLLSRAIIQPSSSATQTPPASGGVQTLQSSSPLAGGGQPQQSQPSAPQPQPDQSGGMQLLQTSSPMQQSNGQFNTGAGAPYMNPAAQYNPPAPVTQNNGAQLLQTSSPMQNSYGQFNLNNNALQNLYTPNSNGATIQSGVGAAPAPQGIEGQSSTFPQQNELGTMQYGPRNPAAQYNPAPQQAPQSVEQQALAGGGPDNKQQIQNFMSALNNVGAGSNNNQMNGGNPTTTPVAPLVNPNVAYQNNGVAGSNPWMTNVSQSTTGNGVNGQNSGSGGAYQGQLEPNTPGGYASNLLSNIYGQGSQSGVPLLQTSAPGGISNNQVANAFGVQGGGVQTLGTSSPGGISNNQVANAFGTSGGGVQTLGTSSPGGISNNQVANAMPQTSIVPNTPQTTLGNSYMNAITSDENLKTNIEPSDSKLQGFLASINAHSYKYKNPEVDGHGTFTSPMAQELEKTELGQQAVINTPRGKMVDYARLGGVNLAASSVLYKEQERLKDQIAIMRKQMNSWKKSK